MWKGKHYGEVNAEVMRSMPIVYVFRSLLYKLYSRYDKTLLCLHEIFFQITLD